MIFLRTRGPFMAANVTIRVTAPTATVLNTYEIFRSEGVLAPQCNIGVLDWSGARMGSECINSDTAELWDTDGHTNIVPEAGTCQIRYHPASKQITIIQ